MKKILIFLILNLFFSTISHSNINIAYLDVQYIIDKSNLEKKNGKDPNVAMLNHDKAVNKKAC